MQTETIVNLIAGGAVAAFLAKLLQQQYEARINDFRDRIKEQSGLLQNMTAGFDGVTTRIEALLGRVGLLETRIVELVEENEKLRSRLQPGGGD